MINFLKLIFFPLLILIISIYFTNAVYAVSFDPTFGTNGIIQKDFGGKAFDHSDFLSSVLFQSDGKIVVGGGSATNTSSFNWTLARYKPDGSLDTSFGIGGIVVTTIRNGFIIEYINDLILQPDNKIVAVGVSHVGDTDVALARYNLERYSG